MREKKIVALIMSIFMVFSLLPATVFAAEMIQLDGQLKIKGNASVGTTLSAELKEVKPEGLAEDSISYVWSRKDVADTENKNLQELSKEKTYTVKEEDLGYLIVLTVKGLEEKGYTGSLKAETKEAVVENPTQADDAAAVPEVPETPAEPEIEVQDQTADTELPLEEIPEAEQAPIDVQTEEVYEEIPAVEELPEETTETDELIEEPSMEAGSEAMEGIPAAQEDDVLTPMDPSEIEGEVQDPEVEEIPEAQEDIQGETGNTEPVYLAEATTEDGTGILDFGMLPVGETADSTALNVIIRNVGTEVLHFLPNSPEHFAVQDIHEPLEPGTEVTVWVAPRQGTAAGSYEDIVTYTTEEGAQASFTAKMTLTEPEEPAVPALSSDKEKLDFSDKNSQSIILTNQSSEDVPVTVSYAGNVVTVNPATEIIPAGGSCEFVITPAEELEKETLYEDVLFFTNDADPENAVSIPVTVMLPAEQQPLSDVTVDTDKLDFGTVAEGYQEAPAEQQVAFTNNGNGDAQLADPVSENGEAKYFDVLLADSFLPAGGTTHLIVRPKTSLAAGTYSEIFTVTDQSTGKNIAVTAVVVVAETSHSLSVSSSALDFASAKKGYGQIAAQQITVTNNGNVTETLAQPTGSAFEIDQVDAAALTLKPGAAVTFTVRPKTGLDIGDYQETIKVASGTAETAFGVSFKVVKATVTLTKIYTPKEITGVANGTKKDAKSLGLPTIVFIETTAGRMKASVTWDVKNCSYNPGNADAQKFGIRGAVTLPDGVDNNNKLELSSTIKVSVDAYVPRTVSADANQITGIQYNGVYTTQSRISFTAIGAGMDNASPKKGDTRYLPLNWTVINTNTWNSAPYTACFGMAQSGAYTLKVTFQHQRYDGKEWKSTEQYSTSNVPFSISKADVTGPGQNLTPGANRRNAVRTGDDSPVLPFVIILVAAAAAIGGVIIYRKKK